MIAKASRRVRHLIGGRGYARDPRDYRLEHYASRRSTRTSRFWPDNVWWGNQRQTSQCVGFAWVHLLEDAPVYQEPPHPCIAPSRIYTLAKLVDEWQGEDYEGTSVRAGAKVLRNLGFLTGYAFTRNLTTLINAVLEDGPVVLGTDWLEGMLEPNSRGIIHATGKSVGGHAYLINGVSLITNTFRIKQSWGRDWGQNGHAYLPIEELTYLLNANGEACRPVEVHR